MELTAYLHDVPKTAALLAGAGFQVRESLHRPPSTAERYAQGFISAQRPGEQALSPAEKSDALQSKRSDLTDSKKREICAPTTGFR